MRTRPKIQSRAVRGSTLNEQPTLHKCRGALLSSSWVLAKPVALQNFSLSSSLPSLAHHANTLYSCKEPQLTLSYSIQHGYYLLCFGYSFQQLICTPKARRMRAEAQGALFPEKQLPAQREGCEWAGCSSKHVHRSCKPLYSTCYGISLSTYAICTRVQYCILSFVFFFQWILQLKKPTSLKV